MVSIMIEDREHSFQRGNAVLSDFNRLGHAQSYKGIHLIYLDVVFFKLEEHESFHFAFKFNFKLMVFTKPEICLRFVFIMLKFILR